MDPSVAPPVDNSQGNSNYALEKLRDLVRSKSFSDEGRLPTERALSEAAASAAARFAGHLKCSKRKG